mmetsp:Transcript_14217/g.26095  ORF Transcript_14217/g.26095 Transcript_14217/m.26095 type:complete len:169 (+) Transcript_14217:3-509(+)
MLFFSFEAVSCFISQNSLGDGQCVNTSRAAMYLSGYLAVLTTSSIASNSVPKSVQRDTAWELSSIASLKGLTWWQRIQGGLVTITAIASLNLLSNLGVEGEENIIVLIVGGTGAVSMFFAIIIHFIVLVRTKNEHQRKLNIEMVNNQRSVRGISSGDIQEGMFMGAFV